MLGLSPAAAEPSEKFMPLGRLQTCLWFRLLAAALFLAGATAARAEDDDVKQEGHEDHVRDDQAHEAHEGIETEHIFGFSEGTDIGEKGEREIEFTTIGSIGKVGNYAQVFNETALRYVVTDQVRLSVGVLSDFYSIHGVPDLTNRTLFGPASGLDAEARFVVLDRHTAPVGIDVGINPQFRRLDDTSGATTQSYAVPMTLVVEKDFLAQNIYTVLNETYTPSIARLAGLWTHEDSFETSAAVSALVAPNLLAGAEVRHLALAENGTFKGEALFTGPSLYARLASNMEAKIAWSAQVSGLSKHGGLDLENFERHQIILLISYTF
jgi:hypothetical protein